MYNGKGEQWKNTAMIKMNNNSYTDVTEYSPDSVLGGPVD